MFISCAVVVEHHGAMANPSDFLRWLYTDQDVVVVQVAANDPRFCPTEWVVVGGPADEVTLADLESLPSSLGDECGWGVGFEVDISKRGGGIGASGATILSLLLGVVGTIPMNHPGSGGGSFYWIPTPAGWACWAA